jgi:hypothetical protein
MAPSLRTGEERHDPSQQAGGTMATTTGVEVQESALPPLPARLVAVFFSPGRLMAQLAREPRWLGALLVSAGLIALAMVLTPAELFVEAQRAAAMERGMDVPEMSERAVSIMGAVIPITSGVTSVVMMFVVAAVYTVIFAFVLGDEGRYAQYLAAVTHGWFIAALFALLVTPLRISTGDPQFSLNLSSFLFFLPDGYILNVFRVLDLTQIWSTLVIAQGAHAIDRRRSFGSAAVIMLSILLVLALVAARFMRM